MVPNSNWSLKPVPLPVSADTGPDRGTGLKNRVPLPVWRVRSLMAQLSPSDRFRVRDPPESGSWLAPRAATAVVVVVFVTLGHGTWVGQWCGLWNRTGQCLGHLTCLSHNSNSTVLTLSPARELLQNLPKNLSLEPTHTMRVSSVEKPGKRRAARAVVHRLTRKQRAQGYKASQPCGTRSPSSFRLGLAVLGRCGGLVQILGTPLRPLFLSLSYPVCPHRPARWGLCMD